MISAKTVKNSISGKTDPYSGSNQFSDTARGDGPFDQVTSEQILTFLNRLIYSNIPYTKQIRYFQISSIFNFVRNNIDPERRNP